MLAYPDGLDGRFAVIQWTDWIELSLLFSVSPTMSRSDVREILELRYGSGGDCETIIEDAFYGVSRRGLMLRDMYPLEQTGVRVSRRRSREECLGFSFLLALG